MREVDYLKSHATDASSLASVCEGSVLCSVKTLWDLWWRERELNRLLSE